MSSQVSEEELRQIIEKDPPRAAAIILERVKKVYGVVPLVVQVLARRPDLLLPSIQLSNRVLVKPKALTPKLAELVALSAAAALRCEFCVELHLEQALQAGASVDEVFETLTVSSMMGEAAIQALGYRKLLKLEQSFKKEGVTPSDQGG